MSVEADVVQARLELLSELAGRYSLVALATPLESCRSLAAGQDLTIAVFGRFKAGKSTLLNRVVGREVLPVGAVPVTAVITELFYAPDDQVRIDHLDGNREEVPLEKVASFVTEAENPGNQRGVAAVRIGLRSLADFRGLRLIDTPGLDSAFEHNSQTTREWLPRVGIAMLAIPADSPLSATDLELIAELRDYTPKVSVILTKCDLLSTTELVQVLEFVNTQLKGRFSSSIPVLPYSIRDGYEALRERMRSEVLLRETQNQQKRRAELLSYKLSRVAANCEDYLALAHRLAQARDAERAELRAAVAAERESLQELRKTLRLIANDAAGTLRAGVQAAFASHAAELQQRLASDLEPRFAEWRRLLAALVGGYSSWLKTAMDKELTRLSLARRAKFQAMVDGADRRLAQAVQDFENRVADRVSRVLGLPMRSVEVVIPTQEPQVADVHIGKVFDHSWELLSWAVPMSVFGPLVQRHLSDRLEWEVTKHLSRLTTQWYEALRASIQAGQEQAYATAEEFVSTLEQVISRSGADSGAIERDRQRLRAALPQVSGG